MTQLKPFGLVTLFYPREWLWSTWYSWLFYYPEPWSIKPSHVYLILLLSCEWFDEYKIYGNSLSNVSASLLTFAQEESEGPKVWPYWNNLNCFKKMGGKNNLKYFWKIYYLSSMFGSYVISITSFLHLFSFSCPHQSSQSWKSLTADLPSWTGEGG